jgi:peptide-methionine (S)-S-oxide reductase
MKKIIMTLSCILAFNAAFAASTKTETAIFAGGCFWSMQHDFEKLDGIVSTTVGYTGGHVVNPSYQQVSSGNTGHYEAIKVVYDPDKISYEKLLDFYWHDIDPTNATGQFCDSGSEYHAVIFYSNARQEQMAQTSKRALENKKRFDVITTKILPAKNFYPAEDYHQHYSDKNPNAYNAYRTGCRRDATLKQIWDK